jgi:hypothetical protein
MTGVLFGLFLGMFLVAGSNDTAPATAASKKSLSVNETMVSVITPATDYLWQMQDPQSDDDWKRLQDAAAVVIAAGSLIRQGGAGPNDDEWAADPAWQAFTDRMVDAAVDARIAARNKNLDALLEAGNVLYPPCEECHRQFHPGIRQSSE